MALTLTSSSFKEGGMLGMDHILSTEFGFGCSGGNKSPQLAWTGAPAGTKSFALTCFDPDAPTGSGFWHWVVVNIPASTTELKLDAGNLKAGLMPKDALQTRTDLGATGYIGPCPPEGHGPHRYVFTLFAVKQETLPVQADILHHGERSNDDGAKIALQVAEFLLNKVFADLLWKYMLRMREPGEQSPFVSAETVVVLHNH